RPTPEDTVVPFMNQIATSPLVSFHRMSLMPSPLKLPVSTTDQVVASEPSPALDKIAEPFISQTALLRERFVAGSFNHPTPPTSVGVGALDGPDARRHGGDVRGGGVQDRGAVHLPDRRVAGRVVPENAALAGAVEVAGSADRPGAGRHGADVRGGGVQDRGAVHQPDRHVAGRVAPENVAIAVAVEVAGADDRPGAGRHGADVRGGGIQDRGAVHQPDRHVAGRVVPEQVGPTVAVEVAGADDRPGGRHGGDVRRGGVQDRGAVHLPDRHVAGRVVPENVGFAVAVEVALADDRPGTGRYGGDIRGGGVQDRGSVHLPDRHIAARIAPGNVAIAVAVEVVGVDGHRQAADLVAIARFGVSFGEPQRAVRPRRDTPGVAISCGDWEFGNHTGGRDAADSVADPFGEPQRAVRPRRDAPGAAISRGDSEFGNHAGSRDATDLVAIARFRVRFGEPQRTIRPSRDAIGLAIGRGDWEFVGNYTGCRDATDLVGKIFGEPQRAVRPRRDGNGAAVGRG